MKAYFLNGGFHIEPESAEESNALIAVIKSLEVVRVEDQAPSGPVGRLDNEEPVLLGV